MMLSKLEVMILKQLDNLKISSDIINDIMKDLDTETKQFKFLSFLNKYRNEIIPLSVIYKNIYIINNE